MKSSFLFVFAAVAISGSGFAQSSPAPLSDAVPKRAALTATAPPGLEVPSNYAIAPSDMLDIHVYQEDDLHSTPRVSKDGLITFPLVGTVHVAGKSPQEAAQLIQSKLAKDFLVNPQVSVSVSEYAKRRFTVLGQVQRPGAYEMPDRDEPTLLQAIGMAGGYTRIADPGKIILKRITNGREQVFKLNGKKMAGNGATASFVVMPEDIITIGESIF